MQLAQPGLGPVDLFLLFGNALFLRITTCAHRLQYHEQARKHRQYQRNKL